MLKVHSSLPQRNTDPCVHLNTKQYKNKTNTEPRHCMPNTDKKDSVTKQREVCLTQKFQLYKQVPKLINTSKQHIRTLIYITMPCHTQL